VFDASGKLVIAEGSLEGSDVGLPEKLPEGRRPRLRELDLPDGSYPPGRHAPAPRRRRGAGVVYLRRFIRNARFVRDIYFWTLPLAVLFTLALGTWLVRGACGRSRR